MPVLIQSKRSKKSQKELNLNREHSTEGKQRQTESENLQASVQGGLSDMVRQSPNGILEDEQVDNWLEGMDEQQPRAAPTYRSPKIWKRHVMRNGKLCQVNRTSQS